MILLKLIFGGGINENNIYERFYHLRVKEKTQVTIDTAFHNTEGIVNFNIVVGSNKLFEKEHLKKIIHEFIFPYVYKITGKNDWILLDEDKDFYDLVITEMSLHLMVRIIEGDTIGLSIMELKHST